MPPKKWRPSGSKSRRARRRGDSDGDRAAKLASAEKARTSLSTRHNHPIAPVLRPPVTTRPLRERSGSLGTPQPPRFSPRAGVLTSPRFTPALSLPPLCRAISDERQPEVDRKRGVERSLMQSAKENDRVCGKKAFAKEFSSPPQGPSPAPRSSILSSIESKRKCTLPTPSLVPAVKSPIVLSSTADPSAAPLDLGPSVEDSKEDDVASDARFSNCVVNLDFSEADEPPLAPAFKCEVLIASRFDELLALGAHNAFIGLDIDETLIQTRHVPCVLLTGAGVQAFQQLVTRRLGDDFKTKNQLCRDLETSLKDKVLVEPTIPETISKLQENGCWVFGITARYPNLASNTEESLRRVGIDLACKSPFPPLVEDSENDALIKNGVIYCSNQNKGEVLNRFCNMIFDPILAPHKVKVAAPGLLVDSSTGEPSNVQVPSWKLPSSFVFIDDCKAHIDAYEHSLHVAKALNLPITAFHFTPTERVSEEEKTKAATPQERTRILLYQIDVFVKERRIVSDKVARAALAQLAQLQLSPPTH